MPACSYGIVNMQVEGFDWHFFDWSIYLWQFLGWAVGSIPMKNILVAVVLVALTTAESIAPMFSGRTRRCSHTVANLSLGLLNAVVSAVLFGAGLLAVTEWSQQNSFGLLHQLPRESPLWFRAAIGLLLLDLWMYCWHRLNHNVPFLWRFHAVHHADRELDASSAVRFHTGEILLSGLARILILPVLGVSLPMLLIYELVLLPVILFHHSNIRIAVQADRLLRSLLVTPWMHWVHHSIVREETHSNYGSVLSIWDRLFGSFRLRANPQDIHLGLSVDEKESSWRTIIGMLTRPFRSFD